MTWLTGPTRPTSGLVAARLTAPSQVFAADDLGRGRLVRLFDIAVEDAFAYYLTWHQGAPLSPAGAAFRDWLRDEIATQPRSSKIDAGMRRARRA